MFTTIVNHYNAFMYAYKASSKFKREGLASKFYFPKHSVEIEGIGTLDLYIEDALIQGVTGTPTNALAALSGPKSTVTMTTDLYTSEHLGAILAHEIGHITLGHLRTSSKLSALAKELEADEYAASITSAKSIHDALVWLGDKQFVKARMLKQRIEILSRKITGEVNDTVK